MLLSLALLVVAGLLLFAGAETFVEHAARAGVRLGVTGLAVGLLLAGAEPEELVTSVIAAVRGRGGLAVGDAIGANVTMLTAVLGLAALLSPLPVSGRARRYLIGAGVLGAAAAALLPGGVGRAEGAGLVVLYVAAVAFVWRGERETPAIGELAELQVRDVSGETGRPGVAMALLGLGVMTAGGWLAVLGAERVVEAFGVEETAVGLSLVALVTTGELFALVAASYRRRVTELAVAAVVGSAGYNATMTLGGAALARPIAAPGAVGAAWLAAGLPLGIAGLAGRGTILPRWGGVVLVAIYVAYLGVLYG